MGSDLGSPGSAATHTACWNGTAPWSSPAFTGIAKPQIWSSGISTLLVQSHEMKLLEGPMQAPCRDIPGAGALVTALWPHLECHGAWARMILCDARAGFQCPGPPALQHCGQRQLQRSSATGGDHHLWDLRTSVQGTQIARLHGDPSGQAIQVPTLAEVAAGLSQAEKL